MFKIGSNIWYQEHRLDVLGVNIGRNVSVIRLSSGEVIVHSTAPFGGGHLDAIRSLGTTRWVLDAMADHDTFSYQGHLCFPESVFLAPDAFPRKPGMTIHPLYPAPLEWEGEVEIYPIAGAPSFDEHVFYHLPSKTLIVCDLLMNFPHAYSLWEKTLFRLVLGRNRTPGTSRRLKAAIKDKTAFKASIETLMRLDFENVILGHGDPITDLAKHKTRQAFREAGWIDE